MLRIRELRLAAGLSQGKVSRPLGLDPANVSSWECGRTMPDARHLPKLAKVLGCTIDDLYTEEARECRI